MDKKAIDNFYFSRFIDSLEQDYEKWSKDFNYNSPSYLNENGKTIRFWIGGYSDTAHCSIQFGKINWKVPFKYRYNIFSHRTRRFNNAVKIMKKYIKEENDKRYLNNLMESL